MSFEGEQQKIEHDGSRRKFSAYISMIWPEEKLMTYDFYDEMNSINQYYQTPGESQDTDKENWLEKTDTDMG